MNRIWALSLICVAATAGKAYAQSYSITSSTITAGGGNSSGTGVGGSFAVTGNIAQLETGVTSTGGTYSVSGGFFSQFIALQTEGAPKLTIRKSGSHVEVSWLSDVPGWVLQTNGADLAPNGWSDVEGAPSLRGAEQFHAFSADGRAFFRLRYK